MISIWSTLLVALLSSGSALIGGLMTNRATEKRLEIQSKLESKREGYRNKLIKAEEVYASILKFKLMVFKIHMDWVAVSKGNLSLNEMNKRALEHSEEHDAIMLNSMLGIYFPELQKEFNESRELLKPANQCFFKLKDVTSLSNEEKSNFVNIILDAGSKFDKSIDNILLELSRDVSTDF
ncbi:hypothetical protein [Erwinia sp. JH02]|uniref:hypothetical protein n=1 Tax=Erwinia sp. JH02 TaxID=2733394 RepID=UPI00148950C3|nr:hypothetical protein [Erwinia sp. JH02]NNS05804.1 hypothetical protein [Erwinia sp. JH02]